VAKRNPFSVIAHGQSLAEAIVDAIREPLLVLEPGFAHDCRELDLAH
jgi:hypothetical protein